MFCKFCGNELPEGANFCTKCGKVVSPDDIPAAGVSAPVTAEYEYVPYEEPQDAERDSRGGSILKFAILGLAFACSFYLSFLGLVFSIIARVKVKRYVSRYNETQGRATVGRHLSVAALVASIVLTAILAIIVIVMVIAALAGTSGSSSGGGIYF
jgi:hypothetical protein